MEDNNELSLTEIRQDNDAIKFKLNDKINHCENQIKLIDNKLSFMETMNDKLLTDLKDCPNNNFKKKSQLQRIYLHNVEIESILHSSKMDYEKLLQNYIKELRTSNNDKVKNIKLLDDNKDNKDTNILMVLKEINNLFNKKEMLMNNQANLSQEEQMFIDVQVELSKDGYIN